MAADDLNIVAEATPETPGRVRLTQAKIGEPDPAAPNSFPVFSRTGAKFGFVAEVTQMDAPFTNKYQIEDEA